MKTPSCLLGPLLASLALSASGFAQTSPAPLRLFAPAGGQFDQFCLGPAQIVRTEGEKLIVTDRQGAELYKNDAQNWWAGLAGGPDRPLYGFTFAFDPVAHRWIAAGHDPADNFASSPQESVFISLSHTEDFLGKWTLFTFDETFVQGDEKNDLGYSNAVPLQLGFGGGVVAVTLLVDDYDGRNETFEEDDSGYVILALSDIQGGTGSIPLTARQSKISHEEFPYDEGRPVPARTFSSAGGLYFLSLEEEDSAVYGLSKLSFAGASFFFSKNFSTFESETLGSDSGRVKAQQPQTTNRLIHYDEWGVPYLGGDELLPDHRQIRDVMVRNGQLWAVHEGIDDDAEVVRTHWLAMRLTTPRAIVQSGRIGGGSDAISCLAPSIAVNADNDVLVGFTATGAHDFPSAAYALRFGGDTAGTMRGIRKYVSGTESFVNVFVYSGVTAWNGFSQTQADPSDAAGLWTRQVYNEGGPRSRLAQATGNVPPSITQQPQNKTVAPNASATFTVAAAGTGLQYQWFHEDELLGFGGNASVTITGANALKTGYYKCRVSNVGGEIWSNAALLKLTTGNPGAFAFVNAAGNDLTSINYDENLAVFLSPWRTVNVKRRNGSDGRVRVAIDVLGRFDPPAMTASSSWDFTGIQTAAPNSNYFSGSGALTFEPGETQKSFGIYIRPDTLVEPSIETLQATMQVDPTLGAVAITPVLEINILDDDIAPTFAQAVDYNVTYTNEGNRWKPQTSVTNDGVDAVQSDLSAPGGETVFSTDFPGDGTLTFRWRTDGDKDDKMQLVRRAPRTLPSVLAEIRGGSGWRTAAAAIDNVIGDTGIDWKFLRGAQSSNLLATGYVDQIKYKPGTGGAVEFEKATYTVEEGAGVVTVVIKRLGHTAMAGIVGVTLQNGTATGGTDFQALNLGVFTFQAGQASRTITFTILPDQITEPVETFSAVLTEQGADAIGIGPVSVATISIADQPGETYATWAAAKFSAAQLANAAISGKDADPDGDAVRNVMEYSLDGNPLSAASAPKAVGGFEDVPGEELQRLTLAFARRKTALDLTYIVQRTSDLLAWQDGATLTPAGVTSFPAIVQLVSATGGPVETRLVRDGTPVTPGQGAWLRLKVVCQ